MTYFNFPRRLDREAYERCLASVIEAASRNDDIEALYLMGGEWRPGISDMDIIVVYRDAKPKNLLAGPWGLSPDADFIFTHRYLSFDRESFSSFYYLYPSETARIRLVYGKALPIRDPADELDPEGARLVAAAQCFDLIVNKLLSMQRFRSGEPVNVRNALGQFYSLTYTCQLLEKAGSRPLGREFSECITALRDDWFSLEKDEALKAMMNIIDDGLRLISDIIRELEVTVERMNLPRYPGICFRNHRYMLYFAEDRGGFRPRTMRLRLGKRIIIEQERSALPAAFSVFLAVYACDSGPFSDRVRQALRGRNFDSAMFPDALRKHSEAVNASYASFLESNGLFKPTFNYGFSPPAHGMKGMVRWLLHHLVTRVV